MGYRWVPDRNEIQGRGVAMNDDMNLEGDGSPEAQATGHASSSWEPPAGPPEPPAPPGWYGAVLPPRPDVPPYPMLDEPVARPRRSPFTILLATVVAIA